MAQEYHVSIHGSDSAPGTGEAPLRTISRAAVLARPGDRVIVHAGEYREWVRPARGGTSSVERIVYEAAPGERVVIKGSERIQNWVPEGGGVWTVRLPDSFFGGYNPYRETLHGDWLVDPKDHWLHPGDVYLNGRSLYEARTPEEVRHPVMRRYGRTQPWVTCKEELLHPEDSLWQWCAVQDGDGTVLYANFHDRDPNRELTEINVRKCCFYPEKTGLDYITVRGFEMAQAACPWAPPTADQPGLLGPNWSRGWIIEHNIIHDAKCSGISIGKEASTGHNLSSETRRKSGYQYQMEAVFRAKQAGWDRERIGSHVIRYNTIYNCGQNAIVGHLGCAFSEIHHNHIYNIAGKHEFFGHEIAGIKLHAAIDVQIHHNRIHHCSLGTWLDWEAQGARLSKNLYHDNVRDLMLEVTHGPMLVDHNLFASAHNLDNHAQGTAYLHNLFCGTLRLEPVLDRSTPYHVPHSTDLAGTAFVYGGDDRFFQNIFAGGGPVHASGARHGTSAYDGAPVSLSEYAERVTALGDGDEEQYVRVPQPVYLARNAYLGGAVPFQREDARFESGRDPGIRLSAEADGVYLELEAEAPMLRMPCETLCSKQLGTPRVVEAPYDAPDGSLIALDTDYLDRPRGAVPTVGPVEGLQAGKIRIWVWNG